MNIRETGEEVSLDNKWINWKNAQSEVTSGDTYVIQLKYHQ